MKPLPRAVRFARAVVLAGLTGCCPAIDPNASLQAGESAACPPVVPLHDAACATDAACIYTGSANAPGATCTCGVQGTWSCVSGCIGGPLAPPELA
jgi:hypothetical protein